jgi:F-type H+-transporting ATPase subunit alpha
MFNSGQRPAVDIGISVSRVGGSAQIKAMKQVVGSLKIDMAQFRELAAFSQFATDLDAKTKAQLDRGMRITEILKQGWDEPMLVTHQVVVFWAVSNGYIDKIKIDHVKEWEHAFIEEVSSKHQSLLTEIKSGGKLTDKMTDTLKTICETFNQSHAEWQLE